MATEIVELFGHGPTDQSFAAKMARQQFECPFIGGHCTKTFNDGKRTGVCTLKAVNGNPVVCCPNRLYANNYGILKEVAEIAFGPSVVMCKPESFRTTKVRPQESKIVVFGKGWGHELPLQRPRGTGAYYVDWVLAKVDARNTLEQFVPIEVQSIDTTGNYRAEQRAYMAGQQPTARSTAGFNWENVNKRILPQLIYKGHVLRREQRCSKGMFFVCPQAVYDRIMTRLGNTLHGYPMQAGAITFLSYDLGPDRGDGRLRNLSRVTNFTTTVDQIATAFTSPTHLPPANVYEDAISASLNT